jgi:tRNA (adenine37-N6)-methyltransferase
MFGSVRLLITKDIPSMTPLTLIKTPFKEKFGIPRQSLLVMEAIGTMLFPKTDFYVEAFRGIEKSSHVWLIFEFHQIPDGDFNGLVRPPRFGGKEKWGVYSTRSPHRPNRLGLSLVKFERIHFEGKSIELTVSGVDLLDGSPILDIKPHLSYVDNVESHSPFGDKPVIYPVIWSCPKPIEDKLIEKIISLDPRPAHLFESEENFNIKIAEFDVKFIFRMGTFEILSLN